MKDRDLIGSLVATAATAALLAGCGDGGSASAPAKSSGVSSEVPVGMVAKEDHAIPPAAEHFMAERAHAHTVEVESAHDVMVSHPAAVTKLILAAVRGSSS